MHFTIEKSMEILERTPSVLRALLTGIHADWVMSNEGPDTFSPFDVVGHLIYGEQTDWAVRARIILEWGTEKPFEPWDRLAMYELSREKTLEQLLEEFESTRKDNLDWLKSRNITDEDLDKTGIHPDLGEVTLRNLLATWVVHDLTHIAQITRVMAKQYKEEIGPWPKYFRILEF